MFNNESIYLVGLGIVITGLYSLLIHKIFGHQTFWRNGSSFRSKLKKSSTQASNFRFRFRKNRNSRDFCLLDSYLANNILTYLDGSDLLTVRVVSRECRELASDMTLWKSIYSKCYCSEFVSMNPISHWCDVYRLLRPYHNYLLKENEHRILVIIYEEVFDVTSLIGTHVGGSGILQEVRGKDGSRLFELASHSEFALSQSRKYIFWSPTPILGKLSRKKIYF